MSSSSFCHSKGRKCSTLAVIVLLVEAVVVKAAVLSTIVALEVLVLVGITAVMSHESSMVVPIVFAVVIAEVESEIVKVC